MLLKQPGWRSPFCHVKSPFQTFSEHVPNNAHWIRTMQVPGAKSCLQSFKHSTIMWSRCVHGLLQAFPFSLMLVDLIQTVTKCTEKQGVAWDHARRSVRQISPRSTLIGAHYFECLKKALAGSKKAVCSVFPSSHSVWVPTRGLIPCCMSKLPNPVD